MDRVESFKVEAPRRTESQVNTSGGRFIVRFFLLVVSVLLLVGCVGGDTGVEDVLFLRLDEQEVAQLHRLDVESGAVVRLTTAVTPLIHYAPAPDGSQIAYVTDEVDGSMVWLIDGNGRSARVLLECPRAECSQLVWHPDGQRLVYERRATETPGVVHLWWLDATSGETKPVLQDNSTISSGGRFSPDGAWLSYVSSPDEGLGFYNFTTGEHTLIPAEMGTPVDWLPDGATAVYRNRDVGVTHGDEGDDHDSHDHDFQETIRLFAYAVATGEVTAVTDSIADDGLPVVSPDGEWIAFGRKLPRTNMGRQIWLVRPDGRDAHALTDDPAVNHGALSWSLANQLLFQRYEPLNPDAPDPAIWILDVESGVMIEIADNGFLPQWIEKN